MQTHGHKNLIRPRIQAGFMDRGLLPASKRICPYISTVQSTLSFWSLNCHIVGFDPSCCVVYGQQESFLERNTLRESSKLQGGIKQDHAWCCTHACMARSAVVLHPPSFLNVGVPGAPQSWHQSWTDRSDRHQCLQTDQIPGGRWHGWLASVVCCLEHG